MKKLAAFLVALSLILSCAFAQDLTQMTAEELLTLREQVNDRLRETGAYPFTTLKSGVKNEDVTALQTRLAFLGYYSGEITGKFDSATVKAMKSFEKQNGLKQNGTAEPEDQIALFSVSAQAKPSPTPTKTPRPTKTPDRSKMYPKGDYVKVGQEPDRYIGSRMRFAGIILQIAEYDGQTLIRLATKNDRDVICVIVPDECVFEKETGSSATVYGVYQGFFSYQNQTGQSVSLPAITAEIIE